MKTYNLALIGLGSCIIGYFCVRTFAYPSLAKFSAAFPIGGLIPRNFLGEIPCFSLKSLIKQLASSKPTSYATSLTERSVLCKSTFASRSRRSLQQARSESPALLLKRWLICDRLRLKCAHSSSSVTCVWFSARQAAMRLNSLSLSSSSASIRCSIIMHSGGISVSVRARGGSVARRVEKRQ